MGDTERARQLARELARLAEEIDGVTVRLDEQLATVENTTGSDLSAVRDDIETIRLSTAGQPSAATRAEFTETTHHRQCDASGILVSECDPHYRNNPNE